MRAIVTKTSLAAWCLALAACGSTRATPAQPAAPPPSGSASTSTPPAGPTQALVSGTVTYRERMALPADAVMDVWIVDTSPGTSAMASVAEVTVAAQGRQVPLPFELHVDPSRVQHQRPYGLKAAIRAGGQTLFANEQPLPVVTLGHPSLVALTLTRVPQG